MVQHAPTWVAGYKREVTSPFKRALPNLFPNWERADEREGECGKEQKTSRKEEEEEEGGRRERDLSGWGEKDLRARERLEKEIAECEKKSES